MGTRRGMTVALAIALLTTVLLSPAKPSPPHSKHQGQGLIIELDNEFITNFENRATITSDFKIAGMSAVHAPAQDGEIHIGGWAKEAGFACVSEVMNAAHAGRAARKAFIKARDQDMSVTVTGAWRIWGEHSGGIDQLQSRGTEPSFPLPGQYPSNPDHVFEIHPVTSVKVGGTVTDATEAISETPGFTPYEPAVAFVQGYETLPCKIIPKEHRTRIITRALGYNFSEFVIRLGEKPVKLDDGHGVICSVHDLDGELRVHHCRMVFVKGTDADDEIDGMKEGDRLRVIGIPRISLKLIKWRLANYKDQSGSPNPAYDVSPLEWHLPYEMIITSAKRLDGGDD